MYIIIKKKKKVSYRFTQLYHQSWFGPSKEQFIYQTLKLPVESTIKKIIVQKIP